jgi:CDP-glycerol glycerophosphotransferase (TagB/SpsB family)
MEVNLLIKHADWNDNLPQAATFKQCIADMRKLHEGNYENLYYIETKENIFPLIALSDLIVSDDSSVMTEALLFHVPSISVSEWRNYTLPYHYVFQCSKAELRQYAEDILKDKGKEKDIQKWSSEIFSNVGKTTSLFMDLVEYYTQNGEKREFFQYRLEPTYEPVALWN